MEMTPELFKQRVQDEIDELIGLAQGIRDRLDAGDSPRGCLVSLEGIAHNAEIGAMRLVRLAPR